MADNPNLAINLGGLERFKTKQDAFYDVTYRKAADKVPYADLSGAPSIPTVPTALSEFANDAGFITEAQAAELAQLKAEIVEELPEASEAEEGVLYLILSANGKGKNIYDEYLLVEGELEKIGSTDIDLTGYLKEEDLEGYLKESDLDFAENADIDALFTR